LLATSTQPLAVTQSRGDDRATDNRDFHSILSPSDPSSPTVSTSSRPHHLLWSLVSDSPTPFVTTNSVSRKCLHQLMWRYCSLRISPFRRLDRSCLSSSTTLTAATRFKLRIDIPPLVPETLITNGARRALSLRRRYHSRTPNPSHTCLERFTTGPMPPTLTQHQLFSPSILLCFFVDVVDRSCCCSDRTAGYNGRYTGCPDDRRAANLLAGDPWTHPRFAGEKMKRDNGTVGFDSSMTLSCVVAFGTTLHSTGLR
jgi:hypothetical protein